MTEPSSPTRTVDEAFRLLLQRLGSKQKAISLLEGLVLWGHRDGRWFEVDPTRYGLYFDTYQTPDGWHAVIRMQPGRIGVDNFDEYQWAFALKDLEAALQGNAAENASFDAWPPELGENEEAQEQAEATPARRRGGPRPHPLQAHFDAIIRAFLAHPWMQHTKFVLTMAALAEREESTIRGWIKEIEAEGKQ